MITIAIENPRSHAAVELLYKSCAYIHELYPIDRDHTFKIDVLDSDKARFFLVKHDGIAVGCGAFEFRGRLRREIELKHIFLDESARGLGCGKALLEYMEEAARQDGVRRIVLETGHRQVAAIGLYEAFGYRRCKPYIKHPLPHAIFMEKMLSVQS